MLSVEQQVAWPICALLLTHWETPPCPSSKGCPAPSNAERLPAYRQSVRAFYKIHAMKGRKTANTYADYLREQPSRLSDFERESRAAEALLRDERQKKAPPRRKPLLNPKAQS